MRSLQIQDSGAELRAISSLESRVNTHHSYVPVLEIGGPALLFGFGVVRVCLWM